MPTVWNRRGAGGFRGSWCQVYRAPCSPVKENLRELQLADQRRFSNQRKTLTPRPSDSAETPPLVPRATPPRRHGRVERAERAALPLAPAARSTRSARLNRLASGAWRPSRPKTQDARRKTTGRAIMHFVTKRPRVARPFQSSRARLGRGAGGFRPLGHLNLHAEANAECRAQAGGDGRTRGLAAPDGAERGDRRKPSVNKSESEETGKETMASK